MFAVAVQNTENLELTLMGPYKTKTLAQRVRESFATEMDARYDLTSVYCVWVVPLRTLSTEMKAFRSSFDLYIRTQREARTLENFDQLDV